MSHSTEHGGSAHTSNTNKCWFGSAGTTKSFNSPANYNTLEISLDYKSLARIFAGIGHVNNIRVMVTDSSDMVLHTSNIYSGARSSGLTYTTRQITATYYSDYDLPKTIKKNMMEKNYLQKKNTSLFVPGKLPCWLKILVKLLSL